MAVDTPIITAPVRSHSETRGFPRHHVAIFGALLLLLIVAPFVEYPFLVMNILCFALFASAFNLLLGYGGLLSFGHAAFFGMGSYVSAHLAKVGAISLPFPGLGWLTIPLPPLSPELAIIGGTLVAALLGLVIGALSIRRQGIYFAMVTLAFAQMVYFFALQAPFTGGEDGIRAVPRGELFGLISLREPLALYVLVVAIFFFGILFIYRIIHSPFGQVLKAIRENEPRAISLGYRVNRYKLGVFVLSTTFAGLAGATKAIVVQNASLTDIHWQMSGEVVLMTLLGGMGTVFGPMLGAAIVIYMQNYLATFGDWVTIIQGTIFVLGVLLFREGIVGVLARWSRKPL